MGVYFRGDSSPPGVIYFLIFEPTQQINLPREGGVLTIKVMVRFLGEGPKVILRFLGYRILQMCKFTPCEIHMRWERIEVFKLCVCVTIVRYNSVSFFCFSVSIYGSSEIVKD
jgi:hypothetical protein